MMSETKLPEPLAYRWAGDFALVCSLRPPMHVPQGLERLHSEAQLREALAAHGKACAEAARLEERERCVQLCEAEEVDGLVSQEDKAYNMAIEHCVAAIRKGE